MRSVRRVVVTALAVLGILAIPASGAQAFEWTIGGEDLSAFGSSAPVEGTGGPFKLATFIGITPITLECQKQTTTSAAIEVGGKDTATIRFTECVVLGPSGEVLTACGVQEPIQTNVKTSLIKVGTGFYDLFEPATGGVFVEVTLTGAECSVSGKYTITGDIAGETEPPEVELLEQPLTFSPAISAASGTELKFGENEATLEGEATNKLIGEFAGLPFGARE